MVVDGQNHTSTTSLYTYFCPSVLCEIDEFWTIFFSQVNIFFSNTYAKWLGLSIPLQVHQISFKLKKLYIYIISVLVLLCDQTCVCTYSVKSIDLINNFCS